MIFIPIAVAALMGAAAYKSHKRKAGITPERKAVYEAALDNLKDPEKLKQLATVFETEGLKAHAEMLTKRASLRAAPPETKKARREAFKKAMASTDPVAVNKVADAFQAQGASGAAANLRKYATGLTTGTVKP